MYRRIFLQVNPRDRIQIYKNENMSFSFCEFREALNKKRERRICAQDSKIKKCTGKCDARWCSRFAVLLAK